MQLIGLCGYFGSGKDTVAALLAMYGYQRRAFADGVRQEVRDAITEGYFPPCQDALVWRDMRVADVEEVDAKPTSARMRRILQWWGTDYRRAEDPDYWVKAASVYAKDGVVFTDIRFPNEVDLIRNEGGVIWRIDRNLSRTAESNHVSERNIKGIVPDKVIENNGTMYELAQKVKMLSWLECTLGIV